MGFQVLEFPETNLIFFNNLWTVGVLAHLFSGMTPDLTNSLRTDASFLKLRSIIFTYDSINNQFYLLSVNVCQC